MDGHKTFGGGGGGKHCPYLQGPAHFIVAQMSVQVLSKHICHLYGHLHGGGVLGTHCPFLHVVPDSHLILAQLS